MKNAREISVITAVKEQYEKFPFPHVSRLEIEDSEHDLRASFNHEFNLQGSRRLEPGLYHLGAWLRYPLGSYAGFAI